MSGMAKGCDACHHYTPANTEHPTCKSCHPVDIIHEDISQPGLKGAYHRQCLSCHSEWDHDTKCEICHEKKAGGRLQGTATDVCEHSHYEPVPLDELIVFPTKYAPGDKVPFHHRSHSQKYERDCTECHQQQSCTRCHVQGGELHPMGDLAKVNLHDTCFKCHDGERCKDCHGRSSDEALPALGDRMAAQVLPRSSALQGLPRHLGGDPQPGQPVRVLSPGGMGREEVRSSHHRGGSRRCPPGSRLRGVPLRPARPRSRPATGATTTAGATRRRRGSGRASPSACARPPRRGTPQ